MSALRADRRRHLFLSLCLSALLATILLGTSTTGVSAQEQPTTTGPGTTVASSADQDLIESGAATFEARCVGCHQPGGVGLEGSYPPLKGNPNVQDAAYVTHTVKNGRTGEIVVAGVTYNGTMPAFATLSDDEIAGLVAYLQAGLPAIAPAGGSTGTTLPVATGTLPQLSGMAIFAALALVAVAFLFVLSPRIVSVTDRIGLPWLDAWLRGTVIVVYFVLATVVVPSAVLKTQTVSRLPTTVGDVIGGGLWLGGLAIGLLGLWYADRERRI